MTRILVLCGSAAVVAALKECRDVEVVTRTPLRVGQISQLDGVRIFTGQHAAADERRERKHAKKHERRDWLDSLRRKAGGY